jgi:flagella basal body P-ring formation protein FlgA
VIAGNSVVTPPIVKEGDRLTIVYETPNLLLSAQGVSLAKGRVGDRIPVRNVDSKTVVYAQVRDKNVVEVN